jgi:metal-responsive CopG/Arc/MetJ family transcriptional regulator
MAKVMISLPDELLAQLDAEARQRGTTRSAFIATATGHELARRDIRAIDEAIARSRARFRQHPLATSIAELVRVERDSRP